MSASTRHRAGFCARTKTLPNPNAPVQQVAIGHRDAQASPGPGPTRGRGKPEEARISRRPRVHRVPQKRGQVSHPKRLSGSRRDNGPLQGLAESVQRASQARSVS
jgi:hypothetical protein